MALSNAQIRAIMIKRSIAKKAQTVATPRAINDNEPRHMSKDMVAACVEAAGFAEHAA